MLKTGEVKPNTTRCDFCSKPSVDIDDDGVARCEEHSEMAASRTLMKTAGQKFAGRLKDRDD